MRFISYLSSISITLFVFIVICYGLIEKKNVFELFIKGVIDGEKMVFDLFPVLLGLFVAVGMLNKSGFIDFLANLFSPIFYFFKIEKKLAPLIILRPISGSTTTAVATSLMNQYGVDSKIGLISSCIMGSTETTIYVATIYCSKIEVKRIKEILIIGLMADFIGILMSCLAFNCGLMSI